MITVWIYLLNKYLNLYLLFLSVKETRTLWKKLRDSHRQALSKKKTATGQAGSKPMWKHEQQMEFLVPIMASRLLQTNVRSTDQENSLDNEDSALQSEELRNEEALLTKNINKEPKLVAQFENEQRRRDRRRADRDPLRNQILGSSSTNVSRQNSALEKFFASMFESTSTFPDMLQLRVQRNIFNIVMEAKEEQLATQGLYLTSQPSAAPPTTTSNVTFELHTSTPRASSSLSDSSDSDYCQDSIKKELPDFWNI